MQLEFVKDEKFAVAGAVGADNHATLATDPPEDGIDDFPRLDVGIARYP